MRNMRAGKKPLFSEPPLVSGPRKLAPLSQIFWSVHVAASSCFTLARSAFISFSSNGTYLL